MRHRLTALLLAGAAVLSCSVALDFDRSYPQREAALVGILDVMPPAGDHEHPDPSLCPDFCREFKDCLGEECHYMRVLDGELERRALQRCVEDCEETGTLVRSQALWVADHCAEARQLFMSANPQWAQQCDILVERCATICKDDGFMRCTGIAGDCETQCQAMPLSFWVCVQAAADRDLELCEGLRTCRSGVEPVGGDDRSGPTRDGKRPRDRVGGGDRPSPDD